MRPPPGRTLAGNRGFMSALGATRNPSSTKRARAIPYEALGRVDTARGDERDVGRERQ
jgi:hypothetical protein